MELEPLFNQIVDAIHEKDGKSDGIAAVDFPNRIREIPNAAPAPDGFFTVTVQSDNPELGTVSGGGIVQNGVNITVKATSADVNLYSFVGWQVDGKTVSNNAEYSFTVTENVQLTAVFTDLYVAGRDWWGVKYSSSVTNTWKSIAYGNGYFVAVAANTAARSQNGGLGWGASSSVPNAPYQSVTFGNGKFVAIAGTASSSGSNIVATTESANSWKSHTLPAKKYWRSVAFGNGVFVAVAYDTDICAFSSDGENWTASTIPLDSRWISVTYGNGKFVAIAESSQAVAISEDGIEWEVIRNAQNQASDWSVITFYNGKFFVGGSNIPIIRISEDGRTWVSSQLPETCVISAIAGGNDVIVALSGGSQYPSLISYDMGAHWNIIQMPYSTWYGLTFHNGKFVGCGSANNFAYSSAKGPNK